MNKAYIIREDLKIYNSVVKHSSELYIEEVKYFIKRRKKNSFKGQQLITEAYNLEFLNQILTIYCDEFKNDLPADVAKIAIPWFYNLKIDRDKISIAMEFVKGYNFEIFLCK